MSFLNINKIWGIYSMKNKIVRQLLTMCMIASLAVGTPVITWASDTETAEQKNTGSDTIEVSENSPTPVIWDEEDVIVKVQDTHYDDNSGNSFYQIEFMVENNSSVDVRIGGKNACVDDFQVPDYTSSSSVIAGKKGICNESIWTKDFSKAGINDFEKWELTLTLYKDNTEISSKTLNIAKEVFEDEENASDTNDVEEKSNSEESEGIETIDVNVQELQTENAELKEKNEELESKYNDLKDENESLKKKNKKLKKQVKELQASQSESNTETTEQEETTPAPEAEETEVSEEATTPVTEYQDATTIRIVQQALNEAGYNCGTPDGVAGGKTTEAITSYQTAKGITVNGLVTDELLQSLGVVEKVQEAVKVEASKAEYSTDYTYDQLSRNPDTYKGKKMKFTGKVLQTGDAGDNMTYARIKINNNSDTIMFITYMNDLLGYRLLEDDNITVYGISCGIYSYKSVGAGTISIPWIHADIIEM